MNRTSLVEICLRLCHFVRTRRKGVSVRPTRNSDGKTSSSSWHLRAWGVILVNMATLAWSTNAILGRWLRDDIGPLTITSFRFTVATAFFCILLRRRPPEEQRLGKDRWWIIAMGLCGVVLFSPLLYLGLRYSTAVNSSLIQGFSPLITALIAGWVIQEPVTRRQMTGAAVAFIGVVGLISGGSLAFLLRLQFNAGDLILLGAAVIWALYSVLGRRVMRGRSAVSATAFSTLFGLPIVAAGAILEMVYFPPNLRIGTIAAIIHICIVPTILGFWCWNKAVQSLGASGAMVFYNTLPLYGVLLGAILLNEPVGPPQIFSGGLIIAGGLLGTLGGWRR